MCVCSSHSPSPMQEYGRAVLSLQRIRTGIVERLSGRGTWTPLPVVGLHDQCRALKDAFHQTLCAGRSQSVLLMGRRGAGKSMVVERVLEDMRRELPTSEFLVVRLNGLVHTCDLTAVKDLTRQINRGMDTLLLANDFTEHLRFLLERMQHSSRLGISWILLLEEFDLFALHPKQTLLYNLLDIVQGGYERLAVVGITCRLDAVELLEKRVKSRFSHRKIEFFPLLESETIHTILVNAFSVPEECDDADMCVHWNRCVNEVFQAPKVQERMQHHVDLGRDVRFFLDTAMIALTPLTSKRPFFLVEDILRAMDMQSPDSRLDIVQGLSVLELMLILAMKRMEDREIHPYNFEMLFQEYHSFAESDPTHSVELYPRHVSFKAFERLLDLELAAFTDSHHSLSTSRRKEYRAVRLLLLSHEVESALNRFEACPTSVRQWAIS